MSVGTGTMPAVIRSPHADRRQAGRVSRHGDGDGDVISQRERAVADEAAFTAFCDREYARLVGAVGLYCGDRSMAEEFVQEALLRAADRWAHVRDLQQPGAWVRRVAMNLANSHYRRKAAERRALDRQRGRDDGVHEDADLTTSLVVRQAVARLPDRHRRVVILRFFLDLSVEQTAAELDVTPLAVTSLTHRAMGRLRRQLGSAADRTGWGD